MMSPTSHSFSDTSPRKTRPLRASCDSCRRRKLKCTSARPACAQCVKDNLVCRYTERGPMGRPRKSSTIITQQQDIQPRKRIRGETDETHNFTSHPTGFVHDLSNYAQEEPNVTPHFDHLLDAVELAAQNMSSYSSPADVNGNVHANQPRQHHEPVIDPLLEDVSDNHNGQFRSHALFGNHAQAPTREAAGSMVPLPALSNPATSTPAPPDSSGQQDLLPCACTANHYLASTQIQASTSASTTHTITSRIRLYRSAVRTGYEIMNCRYCLQSHITGMHNVFLVISLLNNIVLAYQKLLRDVDDEAELAKKRGELKQFMLNERHPASAMAHPQHPPHTADPEAGESDITLSPDEWREVVKASIRRDLFKDVSIVQQAPQEAKEKHHNPVESLIEAMAARQEAIHRSMQPAGVGECAKNECSKKDFTCLKLLDHSRQILYEMKQSQQDK